MPVGIQAARGAHAEFPDNHRAGRGKGEAASQAAATGNAEIDTAVGEMQSIESAVQESAGVIAGLGENRRRSEPLSIRLRKSRRRRIYLPSMQPLRPRGLVNMAAVSSSCGR